uniref:Uncharacterized protein n=1 Tax=Tetranychus urticae TaxID=32264 RepID=T1KRT7_TETUR
MRLTKEANCTLKHINKVNDDNYNLNNVNGVHKMDTWMDGYKKSG